MTESKIYLRDGRTKALVEASLFDEATSDHLALWDRDWVPAMQAFCAGKSLSEKPEDSHWDWRRKSRAATGLLGYHTLAIVCADDLQGLMMANDISSARLPQQFGKPLIYVDFLATAPWNRPQIQDPPRYRGVGQVFLLAAIELSMSVGFKGRVGLHSLPDAEAFYENKCGFTRLGSDSSHQGLIYFEITDKQADAFRQRN